MAELVRLSNRAGQPKPIAISPSSITILMFGISLREVDKTIVKPHLAGATLDTFASVVTRPVENVEALAGQETQRRRRLDDRPLSTM